MHHVFGTLYEVKISRVEELVPRMEKIVEKLKLNEVSRAFHQFEPEGVTGVIVLSESHFAVHTYPETCKVYLDIFCCSENFDSNIASSVIMDVFDVEVFEWNYFVRR